MKIKNQSGSVTLFVIVSMMFILIVVLAAKFSETNKEIAQGKEIQAVQEQYNEYDLDSEYNKALENK